MNETSLRTWAGAVAIITGGASGIGLALATHLIELGAGRVVLADLRADAVEAAAAKLGSNATPAVLDVRSLDAVRSLVAEMKRREGRIDYMFNNAGTGVIGSFARLEPEDWKLIFDVNVHGVVNGVQAAYPVMLEQGFGHIVNTASAAGLIPQVMLGAYSASKHATVGLTHGLRIEAASRGVRASVLCPGAVRTPLLTGGALGTVRASAEITPERLEKWWGRLGPITAEEFARKALKGVAKNQETILVPQYLGVVAWLAHVFPGLRRSLAARDLAATRALLPELFD